MSRKAVTASQRAFVEEHLSSLDAGDEVMYLSWVKKHKRNKVQDRLLVVTQYRVLSVKDGRTGRSVQRSGHLYQLLGCDVLDEEVGLDFGDWALHFRTAAEEALVLVECVWNQCVAVTPGFPEHAQPKFSGEARGVSCGDDALAERVAPLVSAQDLEEMSAQERASAFAGVFSAYCAYYGYTPPTLQVQRLMNMVAAQDPGSARRMDVSSLIMQPGTDSLVFQVCMNTLEYDSWFQYVECKALAVAEDALYTMANMLAVNPHLIGLTLSDVRLSKPTAESLGMALERHGSLRHLDVSSNPLQDKGLTALAAGIAARGLETLNVSDVRATAKGISTLVEALRRNPGSAVQLRGLDVSHNRIGKATKTLVQWFGEPNECQLRRLVVSDCQMDLRALLQGLKRSQLELEELDVSHNEFSDADGQLLAELLSQCPTIRTLDASTTGLHPGRVEAVVASMLRSPERIARGQPVGLDLSHNAVGHEAAVRIASVMVGDTLLHQLALNGCQLGHVGSAWIVRTLVAHPRLRALELDANVLRSEWDGPDPPKTEAVLGEELAALAQNTPTLRHLSLAGDPAEGRTIDPIAMLNKLQYCDIMYLNLNGNLYGTRGALAVNNLIRACPNIRELHIQGNNISMRDISSLVDVLKSHKGLVVLPFPEEEAAASSTGDKQALARARGVIDDVLRRNQLLNQGKSRAVH